MGMCRHSNISMCRACQTCLTRTLSQVVLPSQSASTDVWLGRLNGTCSNMTRVMSELVGPSRCTSMLSLAQQQGDLRYRAGGLCSAMGACDTAGLGACMLNVSSTLRFTSGPLLSGALDTCSVEGVTGGALPPGIVGPVGEWVQQRQHGAASQLAAGHATECKLHPLVTQTFLLMQLPYRRPPLELNFVSTFRPTNVEFPSLLSVPFPHAGCVARVGYSYGTNASIVTTLQNVSSADACCRQCRLNASTCAYWVYRRWDGTCWLNNDQGPSAFVAAPGFVAGSPQHPTNVTFAGGSWCFCCPLSLYPMVVVHPCVSA